MKTVSRLDIYNGFNELGILGERVLVHSSLSSFGEVREGAETLLNVIVSSFRTVLMPAFCWDSVAAPPESDRPAQNGCDYSYYNSWGKKPRPFIVEAAGIERSMGIISRKFLAIPGVQRSDHAWHSWAACGDGAEQLIEKHPWGTTNLPIERLEDLGGRVLLLGVGLDSCTAVHIAEERAGRSPFIRWAIDRDGKVKRVKASGCAKGFNKLLPFCKSVFKEAYIGDCRVLTAPLRPFIESVTSVIVSKPEVTKCSMDCIRCRDAILGGPS